MITSSSAKEEEIKYQVQEGWESKLSAWGTGSSAFVVLLDSIVDLCSYKR